MSASPVVNPLCAATLPWSGLVTGRGPFPTLYAPPLILQAAHRLFLLPSPPASSNGDSSPRHSAPTDWSNGCMQAPATPCEHLVPQDPPSSLQSHFSPSTLSNATYAITSKYVAFSEPRPPFFLAWTLTKVACLMGLFSFSSCGFGACISRRRPPSPPSSPTTASAQAPSTLLHPHRASVGPHGAQGATGAAPHRLL
jgi:hypothetical protein